MQFLFNQLLTFFVPVSELAEIKSTDKGGDGDSGDNTA